MAKKYKESTSLHETKYILQIYLAAFLLSFLYNYFPYFPIKDFVSVGSALQLHFQVLLIQWLNTENNPDTWWLSSIDYRLKSSNNNPVGI